MPTSRYPAHPNPPPRHGYTVDIDMPVDAPPRPVPVTCAVVAIALIGLTLSGMWWLIFTPLMDGTAAPVTPPRLLAAVLMTALMGGSFGLLAYHLRNGATAAVVVSIVITIGGTGAGLIQLAQVVLDYSRGASTADVFARWLESPAEFVLAISISALLAPVILLCLLLPRSLRWAASMHRYRYIRRVQRRGHPDYQPPHYPLIP